MNLSINTLLSSPLARSGDNKRSSSLRSSTTQRRSNQPKHKKEGRKVRFSRKPTIHKVESYAHYNLWEDTKQYAKARDVTFVRYSKVARAYFLAYEQGKESHLTDQMVTPKQAFFIKAGIQHDYRGIERLHSKQNLRDILKSIVRYQLLHASSAEDLAEVASILTAHDARWARYLAKMDAMVVREEMNPPQSTGLSRKRGNQPSPGDKPLSASRLLSKPSSKLVEQYFVKTPPKSKSTKTP